MLNNSENDIPKLTFKKLISPLTEVQFIISTIIFTVVLQYLVWPSSFQSASTLFLGFIWVLSQYITQFLGHSYLRILIDRKMSWEKTPIKKMITTTLVKAIYAVVAYILITWVFTYFVYNASFIKSLGLALQGIKIALLITVIFSFIFSSFAFYFYWQKSNLKAEQLQTELANHRYNTLKNQVNPHFLFNSLNVLADLVHESADLSEKYIHQLSKIYRYVLESTKHKLVSLSEEMSFIKSYIFLLKIRFEDKINFEINVDHTSNEYIIPVAIQTLLENAVKHNETTKENPLFISITKVDQFIIVKNEIQLKKSNQAASETGLTNLNQQYEIIAQKSIIIEEIDGYFIVKLPILNQQNL